MELMSLILFEGQEGCPEEMTDKVNGRTIQKKL